MAIIPDHTILRQVVNLLVSMQPRIYWEGNETRQLMLSHGMSAWFRAIWHHMLGHWRWEWLASSISLVPLLCHYRKFPAQQDCTMSCLCIGCECMRTREILQTIMWMHLFRCEGGRSFWCELIWTDATFCMGVICLCSQIKLHVWKTHLCVYLLWWWTCVLLYPVWLCILWRPSSVAYGGEGWAFSWTYNHVKKWWGCIGSCCGLLALRASVLAAWSNMQVVIWSKTRPLVIPEGMKIYKSGRAPYRNLLASWK